MYIGAPFSPGIYIQTFVANYIVYYVSIKLLFYSGHLTHVLANMRVCGSTTMQITDRSCEGMTNTNVTQDLALIAKRIEDISVVIAPHVPSHSS